MSTWTAPEWVDAIWPQVKLAVREGGAEAHVRARMAVGLDGDTLMQHRRDWRRINEGIPRASLIVWWWWQGGDRDRWPTVDEVRVAASMQDDEALLPSPTTLEKR